MVSRLPSSNDAQDDMTSQFPHASPVPMETDDIELEAPTLAEQQNFPEQMEEVDASNGVQRKNGCNQHFDTPLARKFDSDQRSAVDSLNGHQGVNLIREAQLNAHNINARLQDLSPEQAKLFLNTLSKNLWREDKQEDFSKEPLEKAVDDFILLDLSDEIPPIETKQPSDCNSSNDPQNFMNPRENTIGPIVADIYEDNNPRKLFGTSQISQKSNIDRKFEDQDVVSAAKPKFSFISSNTSFHECQTNVQQLVKQFEKAPNSDWPPRLTYDLKPTQMKFPPAFEAPTYEDSQLSENSRYGQISNSNQKSYYTTIETERENGNGSVAKPKEDSLMTPIGLRLSAQRSSSVTENTSNSQKVSDRLSRSTSKKIHGDLEKEKENVNGFLFSRRSSSYEAASKNPTSLSSEHSSQLARYSTSFGSKDNNENEPFANRKGDLDDVKSHCLSSQSQSTSDNKSTVQVLNVETKRPAYTRSWSQVVQGKPEKHESYKSQNNSKVCSSTSKAKKSEPSPAIISETCSNQPRYTPPSQEISLETVKTQVPKVKKEKIEWLQKENVKVRGFGSTTKKSINILVLGQTGVGKSTWINALVNYLTHKTLDEAIAAEAPICVIPTKFTMYDNNYQRHDVHLGVHDNEVFADKGQSATQSAKTYLCEQDEHNIYIIDTPGMNDTRGHLKDEENIQNILRSIAPFKKIHAICFLFKANEARLTESFRYSIGKLLGNLSKAALNNACFVFTNARGTFYRPGDTMGPLKAYFNELKEKEGLSVRIDDSNIFCLDNEAFRFVCAHFSDIQFDTREIKTFGDSWKHSSNEVQRLLDHAARARPHHTSDTLSINETRTWIYQLIDPILKACTMIQRNLLDLDQQKEELMQAENNVEELRRLATIRVTSMEILTLSMPQTVCRSQKCARYERIDGKEELIYRVCHKDCKLSDNERLDECAVFGRNQLCTECSCHINDHERISYEQRMTTKSLENPQKLASQANAAEMKKSSIRKLQRLIDGYQKESNYILFAMATFSGFLAWNGITQKTNLFEQHLQKLIVAEEKKMKSVAGVDADEFNQLLELSVTYGDICKQFVYQRDSAKISLDALQEIRQKLFSLPLNGAMIAQIFDIHVKTDHQDYEATVTRCEKSMFQWVSAGVSGVKKRLKSFFGGSPK